MKPCSSLNLIIILRQCNFLFECVLFIQIHNTLQTSLLGRISLFESNIVFVGSKTMSIVPIRVITQQPQLYHQRINNTFSLLSSEQIYREWDYSDSVCCCDNSYHTILTDIRLLTRYQEYVCCTCCSEPSHTDSAISLRDINQMRECRGEQPTFFFLLWITLICAWPCYVLRRIFCPKPKCLEVYGAFGSELVRLKREDMSMAQVDLSIAIINSKLIARY